MTVPAVLSAATKAAVNAVALARSELREPLEEAEALRGSLAADIEAGVIAAREALELLAVYGLHGGAIVDPEAPGAQPPPPAEPPLTPDTTVLPSADPVAVPGLQPQLQPTPEPGRFEPPHPDDSVQLTSVSHPGADLQPAPTVGVATPTPAPQPGPAPEAPPVPSFEVETPGEEPTPPETPPAAPEAPPAAADENLGPGAGEF